METQAPGNVLFGVWLVARRTTRLLDDALRESGLSADDFAVYSLLTAGSATPGTLATWLAAPLTTVSSYVKRFEARGHVQRVPDPADRRSYRISLTPEGVAAHLRAGAAFLEVLAQVDARLGAAEPMVRESLGLLSGAVDTLRPGAPSRPAVS